MLGLVLALMLAPALNQVLNPLFVVTVAPAWWWRDQWAERIAGAVGAASRFGANRGAAAA
jgi:hypothetical protein